jgi:hypothetical protein
MNLKEPITRKKAHELLRDGHPWGEYVQSRKKGYEKSFVYLRRCEGGYKCVNELCPFTELAKKVGSNEVNNTCRFSEDICTVCCSPGVKTSCNALKAVVLNSTKDGITEIVYV